jgi:hypothetical protein
MAEETQATPETAPVATTPTMLVKFLRTHPAFGHFVGSVGEVLTHVGQQLIADGFAEVANPNNRPDLPGYTPELPAPDPAGVNAPAPGFDTATVPADPATTVPTDETSTPPTDETR